MSDFQYATASSADDASAQVKGASDGSLIAGGMTLIPSIKLGLATPTDLIDLAGAGLSGISVESSTVTIGAMTRHADVASSKEVATAIPALSGMASGIGDPQVRNRGTIGGSVANNDPAADTLRHAWGWEQRLKQTIEKSLQMISLRAYLQRR